MTTFDEAVCKYGIFTQFNLSHILSLYIYI